MKTSWRIMTRFKKIIIITYPARSAAHWWPRWRLLSERRNAARSSPRWVLQTSAACGEIPAGPFLHCCLEICKKLLNKIQKSYISKHNLYSFNINFLLFDKYLLMKIIMSWRPNNFIRETRRNHNKSQNVLSNITGITLTITYQHRLTWFLSVGASYVQSTQIL